MHELSIALSILEIATQEASRHVGKPMSVHLRLGALSGVVKASLVSAWDVARHNSILSEADLIVEEIPVAAFCETCQAERAVVSLQEFHCSACGRALNKILRGKELELVALELDT